LMDERVDKFDGKVYPANSGRLFILLTKSLSEYIGKGTYLCFIVLDFIIVYTTK
jgi:hypothetical protein